MRPVWKSCAVGHAAVSAVGAGLDAGRAPVHPASAAAASRASSPIVAAVPRARLVVVRT
ncbi:hypothetical protein ABCS02_30370 [Microbacterium sp. X-17]|uniref:hypothetical protein n=1 Tax=Microbacterium sp. X-17 TaxID=3144404 RepID=UPI0031F48E06